MKWKAHRRSPTLNPGATTRSPKLVYTGSTCLPTPFCKAGRKVTVIWPHQALISHSLPFKAAKTHPHPCMVLEEDSISYGKQGVKTPVAMGWESMPNGACEKGNSPPYFPVNQCSIDARLPMSAGSTGLIRTSNKKKNRPRYLIYINLYHLFSHPMRRKKAASGSCGEKEKKITHDTGIARFAWPHKAHMAHYSEGIPPKPQHSWTWTPLCHPLPE